MSLVAHDQLAAAALDPTGSRVVRPEAVIFAAPDGSGRNTLISCLESLGVGLRCKQQTTRPNRHVDDGEHYVPISRDEFWLRHGRSEYLLTHRRGEHWFGEPLTDVQQCWAAGKIALLKGPVRCIRDTKERILQLRPGSHVLAVFLLTEPHNAWVTALQRLRVSDLERHIQEGKAELADKNHPVYRPSIDRTVKNYFGDPRPAVRKVMEIIGAGSV